jgi:hypothetical protein
VLARAEADQLHVDGHRTAVAIERDEAHGRLVIVAVGAAHGVQAQTDACATIGVEGDFDGAAAPDAAVAHQSRRQFAVLGDGAVRGDLERDERKLSQHELRAAEKKNAAYLQRQKTPAIRVNYGRQP